MAKTLYQKLYDAHVVLEALNETPLLYIDRHLVYEVTSPQAFDGLRAMGCKVRQPGKTFAAIDHNVSIKTKDINASGEMTRIQIQALIKNCAEFGITLYDLNHQFQGIVHVIGPKQGIKLTEVPINKVFIGSCTNSRIEDLRAAEVIAKGHKVAHDVQAIIVPGSGPVKAQAEAEGLDKIFIEAGFEWRLPGCSMCLAMNNDRLNPGERRAFTSNRNFEWRQ